MGVHERRQTYIKTYRKRWEGEKIIPILCAAPQPCSWSLVPGHAAPQPHSWSLVPGHGEADVGTAVSPQGVPAAKYFSQHEATAELRGYRREGERE